MRKYPKRGEDCNYTEDCMWGTDGWCDRSKGWKCEIEKMDADRKKEQSAELLSMSAASQE